MNEKVSLLRWWGFIFSDSFESAIVRVTLRMRARGAKKPGTKLAQIAIITRTEINLSPDLHSAVREVFDGVTQAKGLRALSESEKKPILSDLFYGEFGE